LSARAVIAAREVLDVEATRHLDRFLDSASGNRAVIGYALAGLGVGEEKPADVLDSVIGDPDRNRARFSIHLDRR
jgi:hypothetical protein